MKVSPIGLLLSLIATSDITTARFLRSHPPGDEKGVSVKKHAALSHCSDSTVAFSVPGNDDSFDCSWLKSNLRHVEFLCDRYEISAKCRATCGICEDTFKAVELVKDCQNREGRVELSRNSNVWTDCASLQTRDKKFQDEACSMTSVALFCPVACDTFHFGKCVLHDPLPTE